MPEALGKYIVIKAYVDANHAGNIENRRSHSGVIIYLNNAPVIWYSKLQNTFVASSFGYEFVALMISTDTIEALRYKLICFGIPVEVTADVFCDNMSVLKNSSIPTSVLNKRHNSIYYHRVFEAQDAGIIRVGWTEFFTMTTIPVNSRHNLVD